MIRRIEREHDYFVHSMPLNGSKSHMAVHLGSKNEKKTGPLYPSPNWKYTTDLTSEVIWIQPYTI